MTLNGLLALLAVIVLVIAAVLFFFADTELRNVLGIMCLGLAAGWASRFDWPDRRP